MDEIEFSFAGQTWVGGITPSGQRIVDGDPLEGANYMTAGRARERSRADGPVDALRVELAGFAEHRSIERVIAAAASVAGPQGQTVEASRFDGWPPRRLSVAYDGTVLISGRVST